jgi:hypothetical protein
VARLAPRKASQSVPCWRNTSTQSRLAIAALAHPKPAREKFRSAALSDARRIIETRNTVASAVSPRARRSSNQLRALERVARASRR